MTENTNDTTQSQKNPETSLRSFCTIGILLPYEETMKRLELGGQILRQPLPADWQNRQRTERQRDNG